MNIIAFIVSLVLFVGGLVVMGYSFYLPGWEYVAFIAGILITSLGLVIPFHVLKRVDG